MKFATKLSLGRITLLSCALCAAGLILTGKSFSGSLETTRAAMQAQQAKEKYTLERCIFTAAETNTLFSTNTMIENYTLATAAQQYAEQTADANSGLALWVNGAYTLYSNLPTALPRAVQMQAVHDRHLHVHQYQIVLPRRCGADLFHGDRAVFGGIDLKAIGVQNLHGNLAVQLVILYHQ